MIGLESRTIDPIKREIIADLYARDRDLVLRVLMSIFVERSLAYEISYGDTEELLEAEHNVLEHAWENPLGMMKTKSIKDDRVVRCTFWKKDYVGNREILTWQRKKPTDLWEVRHVGWRTIYDGGKNTEVLVPMTTKRLGIAPKIKSFLEGV